MHEITSRERWGAVHEDGFGSAPLPASEVWLHHSVTLAPNLGWLDADRDGVDDDEERAMRTLEAIGESRFGRGISYTFLIMPSGRIYEGHGVDRQGSHTGGRNSIARAFCFVGDYDTQQPTAAQIRSAAWLLQEGVRRGWWKVARLAGGHRDLKATACPGQHAYAAISEINRLAAGPPISEEDDVPITDADARKVALAVQGYRNPKVAPVGRDAYWYLLQTYEQALRAAQISAANQAALAALAKNPHITPEALAAETDAAVKRHTPTVQQTAAALLPMVESIAEHVLGVDNRAQAAEILRQLRNVLPTTETEEP